MPFAPLSMRGSAGGTGCDRFSLLLHCGWNSRDVSMAGIVIVSTFIFQLKESM